jgi:hypothetical protein
MISMMIKVYIKINKTTGWDIQFLSGHDTPVRKQLERNYFVVVRQKHRDYQRKQFDRKAIYSILIFKLKKVLPYLPVILIQSEAGKTPSRPFLPPMHGASSRPTKKNNYYCFWNSPFDLLFYNFLKVFSSNWNQIFLSVSSGGPWVSSSGRGSKIDVVYLGWLIAPSYMSPKARVGGGCGVSANEYSCAHGAQINFGDLTVYLTAEFGPLRIFTKIRGDSGK